MLELNTYETLVAASLVLLIGRKLIKITPPLRAFNIPEPVAGGLVVAACLAIARYTLDVQIKFDTGTQTPLMLAFFATLGLSANLSSLKLGGKSIGKFLLVVAGLLVIQNGIGVGLASLLGMHPATGLLAGSISLSGGHGTSAAWGNTFMTKFGMSYATEMGVACATFGLVLGGLIGGPVARYLLRKVAKPGAAMVDDDPLNFEQPQAVRLITATALIETLALILVCLTAGQALTGAFKGTALELPTFVWVLFVGVLLRNGLAALGWYTIFDRALSVLGNVSLSMFLAMALMSLRLWELASLALPMLLILAVQTAAMAAYAVLVTFRAMGRNYDAAVLAAGHCGFGLGATPTAIANMQAITDRFGPSHLAFLIVPMVGAFFIDIVNAIVIKLFLALPIF
ncbi:MAG: sodium/glutamate symporter [Cupriavidus sp.]|uniref:sodium/glutamate symporter n=1 Tax=Cupriavidus pauculus TaxID=82633 RepID=UPI0007850FCC|nr:sodium/glutamate symporter [Cupriavidus pauculus]MBU68717.1 sodium/glutamate symporter [Cupriavidus sp.]KAB0600333.1 sodium/glutamate symporter [Cupriavidus pauculus]MBY4731498.1 sodium/glutamate symporter [Cupriavidus pauculus]MCM3608271.1 sodium/glutamate symporter [Cupriavidus pauculus]UAL01521.1 sodium/glutamate symporter [Cupriavidus pauculus]